MLFGNRISSLRMARGLTQEEMATAVGITRASLSHYEKNRRSPDYDTLNKFANFFQVTVDYLMGRTKDAEKTLDREVREFVDQLELSDEALLSKFALKIDGRELTPEEAKRFIAFVRAQRAME